MSTEAMNNLPVTMIYREKFITESLKASSETKLRILEKCAPQISKAIDVILEALQAGKKVLLCGNGGSAADAQHLAAEFVIRLNPRIQRKGLPAIALTTDTSILTAGANDMGYEEVFARSVEALGNAGDVLIGISTSGASENINRAFRKAQENKIFTIGLLGKDGGKSKNMVDLAIIVPSNDTQRIQEGQMTIGHIIFQEVEDELFG